MSLIKGSVPLAEEWKSCATCTLFCTRNCPHIEDVAGGFRLLRQPEDICTDHVKESQVE